MGNHRVSNVLHCAALGVILLAAGAVFVAPADADAPSVGGLLFGDNFTIQSPPSGSINTDITWSGRVSGPLAGVISYDLVNAVGTQTMDGSAFRMVDSVGNFPRVGLDYNFNGNVAAGGLKISYDIQCNAGSYDWGALYTGCDSAALPQFTLGDNWNAWMMRSNHYWEYPVGSGTWYEQNWLIYGNNGGTGLYAAGGSTGVDFNDALHHVDIIATDATDARPFNGVGTIQLDYYVDGSYVTLYTGYDYYNNYIGLQAQTSVDPNSPFTYDNLQIYGNNLLVDTTVQWQGSTTDNWTDLTSWTGAPLPNAQDAIARFLNYTSTMAVHVNADVTVGALCMMSYSSYTIDSTGGKITFSTSSGNAQIQAWDSYHTISAPIDLLNNLDIAVGGPYDVLTLAGAVNAPGGAVDVNINNSTYGTVVISGNAAPGGAVTVNNGILQINAGAKLTATSITGNGSLYLEANGVLDPPNIDVAGKLGLGLISGSPVDYTVGTVIEGSGSESLGTTVGVGSLSGLGTALFTLNGGTLKMNTSGSIEGLAHFYIGPDGGTIDTNGQQIVCYNSIEDAPSVTAGSLTVSGSGSIVLPTASTYTGGTFLGPNIWAPLQDPAAFGTGPVDVATGATVDLNANIVGSNVTNDFILHGPGNGQAAITNDWGQSAILTGTITLNDGPGTLGDPTTFSDIGSVNSAVYDPGPPPLNYSGPLTLAGQITGDGGLVLGTIGKAGWFHCGYVEMTGEDSNDYAGATVVVNNIVLLAKTGGAVAVPHDLYLSPAYNDWSSAVALGGNDEIDSNAVVHFESPNYPAATQWAHFALNGHNQTVRGLQSSLSAPTDTPLNGIDNVSIAYALGLTNFPMPDQIVPTDPGVLTIQTQDGDNWIYSGYIQDQTHTAFSPVGALSLVKDGPGSQTFLPGQWAPDGLYAYTGGTTVKTGTLDVSAIGKFTPNSPIVLEGGTLIAGNELSGPITRGATTSGTLEAGGTTYNTLTVTGPVDIGSAAIDAGHTLVLAPAASSTTDAIDQVTGAGDLQVGGTSTTLTSQRIAVNTLTIGAGNKVVLAPSSGGMVGAAPVPEPSALVLLALAGLAYGWFRLRK